MTIPRDPKKKLQWVIPRLIERLDPEKLYSPATLAYLAEMENLFPINEQDPAESRDLRALIRVRTHFSRMIHKHPKLFPGEDGPIEIPGQAPLPGYKGWRFQQVMESTEAPNPVADGSSLKDPVTDPVPGTNKDPNKGSGHD